MSDKVFALTPVGRLVQGDLFSPQTVDMDGRPRDKPQWYIGLALSKTDPATMELIQKIQQVAMRDFPTGEYNQPHFSWKIIDGDSVDGKGQPYSARTGFGGCYVFRLTSGFAPEVYHNDAALSRITDPQHCKRGYYIRVNIAIVGNGERTKPGVYLNLGMTQLCGYGEEITSGPAAGDIFGATAALPSGASAQPTAPVHGMPGMQPQQQAPAAMPGMPGMPGMQPQQQAPAAMPGMQPQQQAPAAMPGMPGNYAPNVGTPPVQNPAAGYASPTGNAPAAFPAAGGAGVVPNPGFLNPQQ